MFHICKPADLCPALSGKAYEVRPCPLLPRAALRPWPGAGAGNRGPLGAAAGRLLALGLLLPPAFIPWTRQVQVAFPPAPRGLLRGVRRPLFPARLPSARLSELELCSVAFPVSRDGNVAV